MTLHYSTLRYTTSYYSTLQYGTGIHTHTHTHIHIHAHKYVCVCVYIYMYVSPREDPSFHTDHEAEAAPDADGKILVRFADGTEVRGLVEVPGNITNIMVPITD